MRELIEIPKMDSLAYFGLAGDLVEEIAPHTESSREGLLLTGLAMFGNAVGFGPRILVDGTIHRPKLDVVLVGMSARSRKGTAYNNMLEPFKTADPYWADNQIMSGLSTGEGLVKARQVNREDAEGNLMEPPDPRLFVKEAEFARTLRVMGREGNTLSPIIRDLWDGDHAQVNTRSNPLKAVALMSIVAHVTVEELQRELSFTSMMNGFANRFLFAVVHRSQRLPWGAEMSRHRRDKLGERLSKALLKARAIEQMGPTPNAELVWAAFYNQIEDDTPGIIGAMTARMEAQMLRLAMLFALMDGSDMIDVDHFYAAGAVWDYCARSVVHIFGDHTGDNVADRILEAVRRSKEGLDETAQSDLFGRHESAERLRTARKTLIDSGLIVVSDESTGGRSRSVSRATAKEANYAKEALPVPATPDGRGALSLLLASAKLMAPLSSLSSHDSQDDEKRVDAFAAAEAVLRDAPLGFTVEDQDL